MDEKKVTSAPEQSGDRDQALFASLRREKQRKKRRRKQSGTEIEKLPVRSVFGDAEKFFHEVL